MIFEKTAKLHLTLASTLSSTSRGSQGLEAAPENDKVGNKELSKPVMDSYMSIYRENTNPKTIVSIVPVAKGFNHPRILCIIQPSQTGRLSPSTLKIWLCPKSATQPVDVVPRLLPQELIYSCTAINQYISKDTFLKKSIRFVKLDKLICHLDILGTGSSSVSMQPTDWPWWNGVNESHKIQQDSPSAKVSVLWHMDVGYGPCTGIGCIKYTILFIDSSSRTTLSTLWRTSRNLFSVQWNIFSRTSRWNRKSKS